MPLSPEACDAFQAATRPAAVAFVDDMKHIRSVVARQHPTTTDARLLSNILRRLLVNGEVKQVASPRMGKIKLYCPDNTELYAKADTPELLFFISGGALAKGASFGPVYIHFPTIETGGGNTSNEREFTNVSIDAFLAQKVVSIKQRWFTRGQVIKHVAIYGSGVHSKQPTKSDEMVLDKIAKSCHFGTAEGKTDVILHIVDIHSNSQRFHYHPGYVDALSLEILAAAYFLMRSGDLSMLEAMILNELADHDLDKAATGTS